MRVLQVPSDHRQCRLGNLAVYGPVPQRTLKQKLQRVVLFTALIYVPTWLSALPQPTLRSTTCFCFSAS